MLEKELRARVNLFKTKKRQLIDKKMTCHESQLKTVALKLEKTEAVLNELESLLNFIYQ